jgi:UDP-N-acetylmuramoylalanine--D-glutamate ligase
MENKENKNMELTSVNSENKLIEARQNSVKSFGNIEHRLEFVAMINDVEYINDSKSTDFSSTCYSLEYMVKPVIWIAGVSEFENDYSVFSELVRQKVKGIICFGNNTRKLADLLASDTDTIIKVPNVEDAVKAAKSISTNGDVILFSPACSSFDMFKDFKERGLKFREAVSSLY